MSKTVGVSSKCAVFKRSREGESQRTVVKILVINVENHKRSPGFCEQNKATEEVLVPYTISHWCHFRPVGFDLRKSPSLHSEEIGQGRLIYIRIQCALAHL